MGHFWDMDKNYGWPKEEPKPVVIDSKTIIIKNISITLEKIEYQRGEERFPARNEIALVLPSGYKLCTKSNQSTLITLISTEDAQYLELLAENKLIIKKFTNPFGYTGYGFITK